MRRWLSQPEPGRAGRLEHRPPAAFRLEAHDLAETACDQERAGPLGRRDAAAVRHHGRAQIGPGRRVPEGDEVAARRRDRDQAAAAVDGDAAAVLAHLRLHVCRRLQQPDAAAVVDADQGHRIANVALVLHRDRDAAGAQYRDVPDAELVLLFG
jgi:hypothetical protein